ncbi:Heterokaryon incompatibility protein 6, OR allele [Madurella mycetomatis]|uniref:Heterokaryon incompatibility protein 6, OR allele n=1 Tax=Madurella mycetomatis TaxID=100816 RepID=A0A175W4K6_9PEZI|nr:Heterokaryon incompatibility protein 6, OR allele [Madurella mycetomatis]
MLPATFQDAIDFTRRLGLRYIWIDSICIIQDSPKDWAEQSSLMADIYGNAHLTICATASAGSDGGCYLPTPEFWRPHKIMPLGPDKKEYTVYVRGHLDERHVPDWSQASRGAHPRNFPLLTRAWAFQERLLSPRLVHFAAGEIMWECFEASDCECRRGLPSMFPKFLPEKMMFREPQAAAGDLEALTRHWRHIVFAFSGLELTLAKDKLPALSGVAKRTLRLRPADDEYLAGLWRKTLLTDICWTGFRNDLRRPQAWRCPSWSWASVDGVVQGHFGLSGPRRTYSTIHHASVTLAGPDPMGEVTDGEIVLSGPMFVAELYEETAGQGKFERLKLRGNGLTVGFDVDCYNDFDSGRLASGNRLACLRIACSLFGGDFCLVLKLQEGEDTEAHSGQSTYQRVGYVLHDPKELETHWYSQETEPRLVRIV